VIEAGFMDTPSKFADKLASLDRSIKVLASSIEAAPAARPNAAWRAEWRKFVRRWELERDSYASWMSRQFLVVANARLSKFEANYLWWAADFEKLTRKPVPAKTATPTESVSASLMPDVGWWIIAAGVVVYAFAKGRK
jgi:hypothetical protein